jgi:hypothetical protein
VIPLGLKVVYTIFVCALVPIHWREYGPANFLGFSDIALLALVPALWLENALLVSMLAISVVFFEALWNVDFFFRLTTGKSLIGLSAHMFDSKIPLFIRIIMFPHRPAASTSLDGAPARLRSPRFSLADNCRAGGLAALLLGEQCTGECELGLWFRRKSAADSVPRRCL